MKPLDIAMTAARAADAKFGKEIRILDVTGISSLADYCVVLSGQTPPQLKALLAEIQKELKEVDAVVYRKSGEPESGWVVLDYFDTVIHIFLEEARGYYDIESLWEGAKEIPLQAQA